MGRTAMESSQTPDQVEMHRRVATYSERYVVETFKALGARVAWANEFGESYADIDVLINGIGYDVKATSHATTYLNGGTVRDRSPHNALVVCSRAPLALDGYEPWKREAKVRGRIPDDAWRWGMPPGYEQRWEPCWWAPLSMAIKWGGE